MTGSAVSASISAALAGSSAPHASREPTDASSWVASDLLALTAPDAVPPCDLVRTVTDLAALGTAYAATLGGQTTLPGAAVLSDRERLCAVSHTPSPGRSLRGATRLAATADGWVAINLARPEDEESLPALSLGAVTNAADLISWLRGQSSATVVERADLLGMAVSAVPAPRGESGPAFIVSDRAAALRRMVPDVTVLDLSRLWAGPLAGALLAEAGARVIRVVDATSPPPVEPMDAAFESRLNGAKETVRVDVSDRGAVAELLAEADVVITSMRPSALARFPRPRPDTVHLMISAHGAESDRAGFGDDCAAAGGLVAMRDGRPEFLADAIADPLTGMLAAVAALGMLSRAEAGRIDLSLSRSAAWAVGLG